MDVMTNAAVDDQATVAPPRGGSTARRLLAGVLIPLATVVIAALGLRTPGPLPAVQAVAFGLVGVGAVSGAILARSGQRVALWQVAFGVLAASVALTAARMGDQAAGGHHQADRAVATVAVPIVIAVSVHMLLALPDGRLAGWARRAGAGLAYAAAVGARPRAGDRRAAVPGLGGRVGLAAGRGVRSPGGAAPLSGGVRA